MSKKMLDIKFAAREYESEGKTKTAWTNHGTLFINEAGRISIKIDSMPVGENFKGWFQVFEQKPRDGHQGLPKDDEDLPF
jgi:hypothetical protein